MKELNVAIIGYKFMGKAHSNAWKNLPHFFSLDARPVMKVACGRHEEPLQAFADNWGWQEIETDWKKLIERDDIDIIDIASPPAIHREIAIAAAQAGKHIVCEKPMALNAAECRDMVEAVEAAGVVNYINFNYRRCPAVMLAKQIIDEGKIGRIYHWRGAYLQSWPMDPQFPLTWHMRKELAGSGPQAGINSHSLDLARFLVGEIESVAAMTARFVKERPLPDEVAAGTFKAAVSEGKAMGEVTVEDAISMLVKFENGAMGTFDATHFAPGRKNYNYFEIYGSKGSLSFNLERLNELQYYSMDDPDYLRGFRTILATEPNHPYIEHWWPPGHNIGYEHQFHNAFADFIQAILDKGQVHPNFYDGLEGDGSAGRRIAGGRRGPADRFVGKGCANCHTRDMPWSRQAGYAN